MSSVHVSVDDMQNGDFYIGIANDKVDDATAKSKTDDEVADLSNVNLEDVDLDAVSKETKDSEETEADLEASEASDIPESE